MGNARPIDRKESTERACLLLCFPCVDFQQARRNSRLPPACAKIPSTRSFPDKAGSRNGSWRVRKAWYQSAQASLCWKTTGCLPISDAIRKGLDWGGCNKTFELSSSKFSVDSPFSAEPFTTKSSHATQLGEVSRFKLYNKDHFQRIIFLDSGYTVNHEFVKS